MRVTRPTAPRRPLHVVLVGVGAAALALLPSAATAAEPARSDYVRTAQYWLSQYGIRTAWDKTQGAGVVVAVIDTGVDPTVPELQGALVSGTDVSGVGSSDGFAPTGGEESWHGTAVAALIAGRGTGQNSGVIGVAPAAKVMPISVSFTDSKVDSDEQIATAVRWAVDHGADVINMSLTRNTLEWPVSWDEAFLYAMDHDVVIVAAAGNRGAGTTVVGAPATMPGVLTVGGVDRQGVASELASTQGFTIGVTAPSEQLVGVTPGGSHILWDGTSGATPIVAGVVALVRSAYPDLDAANVINRVIGTADDAGAKGPDVYYGYGLIDAAAAVTARVTAVDENPMGSLAEWIRVNRPADSEPVAIPTPVVEVPEPTEVVDTGLQSPTGQLLPAVEQLRAVGPGALAVALLIVGIGALGVWAVMRVEGVRRGR